MTNLAAALSFIRQMSRETLTITDEEYLRLTRESLSASSASAIFATTASGHQGANDLSTGLSDLSTHDLLTFHSLPNLCLLESENEPFENIHPSDPSISDSVNETKE